MGRGNRVRECHQNAPRGSPRRPGPTWAVVAHEAGGRLRSALAARGPSCARHSRHTASWGVGPPESVTVVLPDQAAFCSLLCCLGFWEGAQVLLLEARRVTPLLCNPCFSLSRRPAARLLHKEAQDCLHLKTSILNFLFHSPHPRLMSSFKGRIWGRLSLGRRGVPHCLRPQQPSPGGKRTAPLAPGAGPILLHQGLARAPLCAEVAKGPEDLSRTEPLFAPASQLSFLNTVAAAQPTEFSDFFIPPTTHTWR